MIDRTAPIFLAGHRGLVGSAVAKRLATAGFTHVVTRTRQELDLSDPSAVDRLFDSARPRFVVLAAARVGGILANSKCPGDFIRDNLQIQLSVLEAARRYDVEKLVFLGSSCIYPKLASQPIRESELMNGWLEPTNAPYAVAKIAGIQMCQAYWQQYGCRFVSAMPTNIYGPGDNFDLTTSHVLPALIRKFHEAKEAGMDEVVVWGSGTPRREFLHVDDLADAILFLMDHHESSKIVNVGTGEDVTILDLAQLIGRAVGFEGQIAFDTSKPDGTPRKLLDVSRMAGLGWTASIGLEDGVRQTYEWFVAHQHTYRS